MNAHTDIMEIGLTSIDGEPRARDLDIADRLGFARATSIRVLIERHKNEIEEMGTLHQSDAKSSGGRPSKEYWLTEEQALLVASLSDAPRAGDVRRMLIKVFVAWRRGHLPALNPNALARQIAAIVDEKLARQTDTIVRQMLPDAVHGFLAQQNYRIRQGKTAKEIWDDHRLPPQLRGSSVWFGNRLREMGASIDHEGRFDRGNAAIRLFDPDKAEIFLRNGLLHRAKVYASERMGQGTLRLVSKEGA